MRDATRGVPVVEREHGLKDGGHLVDKSAPEAHSMGGGAGSSRTLPSVFTLVPKQRRARFQRSSYFQYCSMVSPLRYRVLMVPPPVDKERTGRYQGPDYYTID
jgi:hypothetical protein